MLTTALLCLALSQTPADAPTAATGMSAPAPTFAVSRLNVDELWGLRIALEESKPSIAAPMVLLGTGIFAFVTGGGLAGCGVFGCDRFTTTLKANSNTPTALIIAGSVLTAAGVALVAWGAAKLFDRTSLRHIIDLKIRAVDQQLAQRAASVAPAAPVPAPAH